MDRLVEYIYCEHAEPLEPDGPEKAEPFVQAIDIGRYRRVLLCDLCAAKVSVDVVKELLGEIRLAIKVGD